MFYAPTYCPHSKCDPCKPAVMYHISAQGDKNCGSQYPYLPAYTLSAAFEWQTYDQGNLYIDVSIIIEITVSGFDINGHPVSGTKIISGTRQYTGPESGGYIAFPLIDMGFEAQLVGLTSSYYISGGIGNPAPLGQPVVVATS